MMGAFCAGNATEQIKCTDEKAILIYEEECIISYDFTSYKLQDSLCFIFNNSTNQRIN